MKPCPGNDSLHQFSLGRVNEPEAEGLEAHLAQCPHCVDTLHTIKSEDTLIEAMRVQSTLARPKIDTTVSHLMVVLKGWNPAGSLGGYASIGDDGTTAAQELISLLAPPEGPEELGRLGSYKILRVLGVGGMGVVFEAEDALLRRRVALKVLQPMLAANSSARKRFLREARATAAVAHDHIVTIFQVGEDRNLPFLAMQFLEGETLEACRQREGSLPVAEIVRIGEELAQGLAAAHSQGLLHRDVKPANIWLEADRGRAKILDFGLAWVADGEGPLTAHGTVVGTPAYMSPEQARGEPADVRSDLFSLGSVLYVLCTGRLPFVAASAFGTMEKVRTETPCPIRDINPAIPEWLDAVVTKLLGKNPDERFQSAGEVAARLANAQCPEDFKPSASQDGWQNRPTAESKHPTHKRMGWWAAAAALLLLALAGLTLCDATGLTHVWDTVVGRNSKDNQPLANGKTEVPVETPDPTPKDAGDPAPEVKTSKVYPAALFAFEERGAGGLAPQVTDILFAKLAARPELFLVDRADLNKILGELELNLSGAVKPAEANKVGQLTGTKLLITGSVIQVDKKTYLVAKIIGTETSRVLGASVDGKSSDELGPLVEKLADQVAKTIARQADKLVPRVAPKADRIAALKQKLKGERPVVMVQISERHIGTARIDPAAQTEVSKFCKETGFTVVDPEEGLKARADILIAGEAFSETAVRHGNLVSVKARVELKAVERKSGTILAIDRQTALVVDLAENTAAKAALEESAGILAERILPKLVRE